MECAHDFHILAIELSVQYERLQKYDTARKWLAGEPPGARLYKFTNYKSECQKTNPNMKPS